MNPVGRFRTVVTSLAVGINDEVADARRRESEARAVEAGRVERLRSAAEAETAGMQLLAERFAEWASTNGVAFTRRSGFRRRGQWAVVSDRSIGDSGKSTVGRVLIVDADGRIAVRANVSLAQARAGVVEWVRRSGHPWPWDD